MEKIVFFGNCQVGPIFYNFWSNLSEDGNYLYHSPACHVIQEKEIPFLHKKIKEANFIVLTFISEGYRNNIGLDTKYILNLASKECLIFVIPSCYFCGQTPEIIHFFDKNNKRIVDTFDYHNKIILNSFYKGNSIQEAIKYFYNYQYSYKKECFYNELEFLKQKEVAQEQYINEIRKKNTYYIPIYDIIKNNHTNNRLFWTFNHPTSYILNKISNIIYNTIYKTNDLKYNIVELDGTRFPISKVFYNNFKATFSDPNIFKLKNRKIQFTLEQAIINYYRFYNTYKDYVEYNIFKSQNQNGLTLL